MTVGNRSAAQLFWAALVFALVASITVVLTGWMYMFMLLGEIVLWAVLRQFDSDEGRAIAGALTAILTGDAYATSAEMAEALLMALRIARKKNRVALSSAIHPHYREVVRTYLAPGPFELVELPIGDDGRTDLSSLAESEEFAAVALQSPNFFGVIECPVPMERVEETCLVEVTYPDSGGKVACAVLQVNRVMPRLSGRP